MLLNIPFPRVVVLAEAAAAELASTYSRGNLIVAGMTHARINRGQSRTSDVWIECSADVSSEQLESGMAIWCVYCEYGSLFWLLLPGWSLFRREDIRLSKSFSLACTDVECFGIQCVILWDWFCWRTLFDWKAINRWADVKIIVIGNR